MTNYRIATPADADVLSVLGRTTFTETFGHLYHPDDLAAFLLNHSSKHWVAELANPAYSVRIAEEGGAAVGYAKLAPPSLPFEPRGASAELRQLYVLKPWHGRGIAQELMRWAIEESRARGAEDLYLSVFIDNHRARRFYENHGFEFVGTYAFMVGNHADEDHVMRLKLGD
jgi:ribosomal protein S18 acetylase RimI-like enzyme